MVEVPKDVPKDLVNTGVIMSTPQVKTEDVVIEHAGEPEGTPIGEAAVRKPKNDPLEQMRKDMEAAQKSAKEANEREASTKRELESTRGQIDTTRANLAKSESEKVVAQEAAVVNRVEAAKTAVENAERALEEAIDTGKPAKEQINLQKRLAEAVYQQKGAEGAKAHFDNWKEREKNKPAPKAQDDGLTEKSKKWIGEHPKYNTDKHYRRAAIAAHEDAVDDGVGVDSDEYFRRINEAVGKFDDGDNDNDAAPVVKKKPSGTSTAAPASHDSTTAGARGGQAAEEQRTGRRIFKLDGAMREMALKTYGKNSTFKLSDDEAYKKYAARQLEIRDKRANGEKI